MSKKYELIVTDNTFKSIDRVRDIVIGTTKEGHPRSLFDVWKEGKEITEKRRRYDDDDYEYGGAYGSNRVNAYENHLRKKGKGGGKKSKHGNGGTWHI